MTNALRILFSIFLSLAAISVACSAGETVGTGNGTGTGNTTGAAGTLGIGNTTGSAGTTGAGNVTGRGGTTGSGNVTGAAGTGAGNVTGAAGTGAGNVTGAAGTGAGNVTGTAGTIGTTGAAGTIGTGTAGTTGTGTCSAAFDVAADGFARAPAAGGACWRGYAFAGGDAGSMILPTTFMACGAPCMLKMTGTVGPAVAPSYAGVGFVGFNVGQDAGGTGAPPAIRPTGSSVTVNFTATTGGLPLRVQLGADTTGSVAWCYTVAAPASGTVTVPFAMFNRTCWDNMGAAYAKEPIVSIQLVVPGGATATTGVSVAITGVKENP